MKSERQLLEDPFYGEPKSSDSHPGKFKGKMKWPLGREAPLKPIDVYLTISDANYWRGVAILDKPFDRVVVSIKKDFRMEFTRPAISTIISSSNAFMTA